MANEKTNPELDQLAFEIFKQTVAGSPVNRGGEQQAISSYAKAEAFLAVREKVRSGAVKPERPTGPKLAEFCAPNLPSTHPHNLVSQRFGSLDRVVRIKKWLDEHPTPESDPQDLVPQINRQFPDLSWDLPAINTARAIFQSYVPA